MVFSWIQVKKIYALQNGTVVRKMNSFIIFTQEKYYGDRQKQNYLNVHLKTAWNNDVRTNIWGKNYSRNSIHNILNDKKVKIKTHLVFYL